MGRHRQMAAAQGSTIEQYTTPASLMQRQMWMSEPGDDLGTPAAVEELPQAELLVAIQGLRVALEGKIETVAVEVNLLQEDIQKVSDKVKVAKGSILELQTEVGALQKQMAQVTSKAGVMEGRLKDAEGEGQGEEVNDGWNIQSISMGRQINMLTWNNRGLKDYTARYRVHSFLRRHKVQIV
ncbi:hypothetical protein NDU88_003377 [Pleurodeles waltl]|uniref:Uncharacterized protein n=1 Tax=Pleurodeles waltl TaxID=8319 RepID=A0AAV7UZV1_PLEWA|nr:hypothetical protein NDU88_003377 [Pleurodeles waltl]